MTASNSRTSCALRVPSVFHGLFFILLLSQYVHSVTLDYSISSQRASTSVGASLYFPYACTASGQDVDYNTYCMVNFGDGSSSERVTYSALSHVYTRTGSFTPTITMYYNKGTYGLFCTSYTCTSSSSFPCESFTGTRRCSRCTAGYYSPSYCYGNFQPVSSPVKSGAQVSVLANANPTVSFTQISPQDKIVMTDVVFQGTCADPLENYVNCEINFGDGSTYPWTDWAYDGQAFRLSHAYTSVGSYAVSLRGTDTTGLTSNVATSTVIIIPEPKPELSASVTSGVATLRVTFTGRCLLGATTCTLDLGDGNQVPFTGSYTYDYTVPDLTVAGYVAKLTSSGGGTTTKYSDPVTIHVSMPVDPINAMVSVTMPISGSEIRSSITRLPSRTSALRISGLSGPAPHTVTVTAVCSVNYGYLSGIPSTSGGLPIYSGICLGECQCPAKSPGSSIGGCVLDLGGNFSYINTTPLSFSNSRYISFVSYNSPDVAKTMKEGTSSNLQSVSSSFNMTFSKPGIYILNLTSSGVGNSNERLSTSEIETINVTTSQPAAELNIRKGSSPKGYTFTANCASSESAIMYSQSNGIQSCTIDFGDGSSQTIAKTTARIRSGSCYYPKDQTNATISHVYANGGVYNVNLTAVDQYGGAYTNSTSLRVNEPPSASITVERRMSNGAVSSMLLAATFRVECSDSDGSVKSCVVDFGDGSSQSLSDVRSAAITNSKQEAVITHDYANGGTYTVTVTATDSDDEITISRSVSITTNAPPAADLSIDKSVGKVPLKVKFTSSCSDPDGSISSCLINFGDGTSRDVTSLFSSLLRNKKTAAVAEHTYTKPGTYSATIMAKDDKGAMVEKKVSIQVGSDKRPVAMNVKNVTGAVPLTVNFSASCKSPSSQVSKCTFDFGDDSSQKLIEIGDPTSPTQSVSGNEISHTYLIPGRYTATLTTTDIYGNTNSSSITINALPKTKK